MKLYLCFVILLALSCKENTVNKGIVQEVTQVSFETVDYEGLETYLENSNASVHVVNFWATWCKPCVKELPHFEELGAMYKEQDVKVILVSLDFPDQMERLTKFIKKKNIRSEVVFLDDADANGWIPKVDPSWSGAIPATIIYNKDERSFYERSFTYEEIEKELKLFL